MATESEILADISNIYRKIDQCYKAKEDIAAQIVTEKADIVNLEQLISTDLDRISQEKRPRYDVDSMRANITRCNDNIALFNETIKEEDANVKKFQEIVKVLQEDMARPTEIIIDMSSK
jgi:predicted  nucleic acid-binding Zn-ribbon protein